MRKALPLLVVIGCTREPPRRSDPPADKPAPAPAKTVAKPLLDGVFELVSVDSPDGTVVKLAEVLGNKQTLWSRWYLKFSPDQIEQGTQRLDGDAGKYSACEVAVAETIQWTATGYTIPIKATAVGKVTWFKTLTRKDQSFSDRSCQISLEPSTVIVIPDDPPSLRLSDGSIAHLARVSDDLHNVDWKSHFSRK